MSTASYLSMPTIDNTQAWQAVLQRDSSADADLVYAVITTGIFCRPSCPSRRPAQDNVLFFPDASSASQAGYRACKRCKPDTRRADAIVVEKISKYIERHIDRQITLSELAKLAGMSAFTVQRIFQRVTGVSPAQYQRQLRAAAFRHELVKPEARVTDAIYDAGYSGPSRMYESIGGSLGMQPSQYRAQGRGLRIGYTTGSSPLGRILVAATERGLCAVIMGEDDADLEQKLRKQFPAAELSEDGQLAVKLGQVLDQMAEHPAVLDLPLDLRATAFQMRVWEALRRIPRGETRTYAEVAREIGQPTAVRAVANACASNPVAVVIPCHRVVGSDGKLTGYRWGVERKKKLLEIEKIS